MRQGGGLGGCLLQVLFVLAVLAVIGLVDWSTVGNWVIFMLVIPVIGIGFILFGSIYSWLTNSNEGE